jgi:hypothetical protein
MRDNSGRMTAVKKARKGPDNSVDNPSPIAHQAIVVFGFSLNVLIIGVFILLSYNFLN